MTKREKVIKGLKQCISCDETCTGCPYDGASCTTTLNSDALDLLREQDKKGTWRDYEGMLKCSVCGAEFYKEIMEYCGDKVPHFCPDCGAEMVGV